MDGDETEGAARQETDGPQLAPPSDHEGGAGTLAPPPAAAPRRFATWWTIVTSILLVGMGVLVVAGKRGAGLRTSGTDPLKAFDHMVQRQASKPPLSPAVAADAEHTLEALITDGKQPTAVANGARARLVVVLGESGRWAEAERYLLRSDHLSLVPVVICAYGRDNKSCATLSACDDANLAALETLAGPWAVRRACKAAALRRGDAAAAAKLDESLVERTRRLKWSNLQLVLFVLLLFAGTVAGLVLVRAQRRSPAPPPSLPPAPWTKAELYAALVRCAVVPLILVIVVLSVLDAFKVPSRPFFGIALYLFAWAWVARLVFRRFGLSWTDALFARRGEPSIKTSVVALFAIAAIGLDRAGHFTIRSAADALGLHAPWSDALAPQTAQVSVQLIAVLLEVVILAPLIEELVCRRVIFAAFRRRQSFVWAALASAAIFAAPHAYGTVGTSAVMWTGLVTAWAYDRTGSLWPSVLVHASGNALAVLSGLT